MLLYFLLFLFRLSFVTEQVAEHTNGTIGALLNATFGNAPELLISVAALRSGYYRVVQLAMLGSMLTNLLLVFGLSCFIGGLRFQVQSLRLVSGNVNVVMLYVATAGSLFPAALSLAGQYKPVESTNVSNHDDATATSSTTTMAIKVPTPDEITFSRVNAAVMLFLYLMFLVFQLETHKEEFDDSHGAAGSVAPARRNLVCLSYWTRFEEFSKKGRSIMFGSGSGNHGGVPPAIFRRRVSKPQLKVTTTLPNTKEMASLLAKSSDHRHQKQQGAGDLVSTDEEDEDDDEHEKLDVSHDNLLAGNMAASAMTSTNDASTTTATNGFNQRRRQPIENGVNKSAALLVPKKSRPSRYTKSPVRWSQKSKDSDRSLTEQGDDDDDDQFDGDLDRLDLEEEHVFDIEMDNLGGIDEYDHDNSNDDVSHDHHTLHKQASGGAGGGAHGPLISLRIGILWLFIITLCISAMSDILVDTIDGFAQRLNLSQVFTSMVVIPFFSNVAEQVSAFLFAFRNEMDLCIGVTVGSAIQILTFVLPGSVLIGMMMDRSMTLYSYGYETVCLAFSVIVVGSVLQNGTTNWLTGVMLVGIYVMLASGIWFHELEDLTVDSEIIFHNVTTGTN
jgi:Ca2+/H+ antiporter